MPSTFNYLLHNGLLIHLNSTSVHLLQAQRILSQDDVSCAWHHCLWVWTLMLLYPCRRDPSWCLLWSYLSLIWLCHRAMIVISSTASLLLSLLWSHKCYLWSVYLVCVVLLVPRNLSQFGATYIPCLLWSVLRACLILFAFGLLFLLSHKFKVDMLFDSSRLCFLLSCFPKQKSLFLYSPFLSNFC